MEKKKSYYRFLLYFGNEYYLTSQQPITWSEKLPCTRDTAFLWTSLFWERFCWELRISFKSHKAVDKTYRPKNDNFCLLMTLRFPFWYLNILRTRSYTWRRFHFRVKRCPKMCLKINRSVKTPLHRPSMELFAPGYKLLTICKICKYLSVQRCRINSTLISYGFLVVMQIKK